MRRPNKTGANDKAVAPLEFVPDELRASATAYRLRQAEKVRSLRQEIEKGMQDIKLGRIREWDFGSFLRRARTVISAR
jgi:hypothetical protein